jgi:pyruvate/2-oxoglutarate/acetoin dehydrogenase E1 component
VPDAPDIRQYPPGGRQACRVSSVEVVDPRTLVPLDEETILASVAKTSRLVIVHEAVKRGGFGAEIAAMVTERGLDLLDAPIVRVAARNVPMRYKRQARGGDHPFDPSFHTRAR